MSTDYDTRDDRAALEADVDQLPTEITTGGDVSSVVSVRLHADELTAVEEGARSAGMALSTFIRRAALAAASPLDVRAASARAEAIQNEARELVDLLHRTIG